VLAAIVLAASTRPADLLAGLDRLRLPRTLVAIVAFMLRYAGVVASDLQRMRVARASRGFTGGRLGHLRIEAAGVGALFVRTYERGERVHQAMVARGYTGTMPSYGGVPATAAQWATCAVLPAWACVLLVLARSA
jgi:cobalt/nickel transport system permease protein